MSNISQNIDQIIKQSGMVAIATDYHRGDHKHDLIDNGVSDPHEIAKQTKITESKTLVKYTNTWRQLGNFAQDGGYASSLRGLKPDCVRDFLISKLETGRSWNTLEGYCSAIGKLDACLTAMSNPCAPRPLRFEAVISEMRPYLKATAPHTDVSTRAYTDPQAVVNAIQDPRCQLAAELQLSTGLRCNDALYIRHINADGTLYINSKAGRRVNDFAIPADLAARLREFAPADGSPFRLASYQEYSRELRSAAEACGEHWTGTHALRHNWAKASYADHLSAGMSPKEARAAVSEELFHHRLEIVETYLR